MRHLYLLLLAFTITLAAIVGWRISSDGRAIALGVIAGVAASIPTSLLIAWVTARVMLDRHASRWSQPGRPFVHQPDPRPPIIIVQSPSPSSGQRPEPRAAPPGPGFQNPVGAFYGEDPGPRTFTFADTSGDEIDLPAA
jgi:hypothetical protein